MKEKPTCEECERLHRNLESAIRHLIKSRESGNSEMKAWREAREQYARHMKEQHSQNDDG
jgi:hypothetical protein